MQALPDEAVQAIRSLYKLLTPLGIPKDRPHSLFRHLRSEIGTESYYAVFRWSRSRPRTIVASFLAIRQARVDAEVLTTFTHIAYDGKNRNARMTQGIVVLLDLAFYFIGGTSDANLVLGPEHALSRPQPGATRHQIPAKGLKAFSLILEQLNRHWMIPEGVYLSNDAGWKPIAERYCMLHLGYEVDVGRSDHLRVMPDLLSIDRVTGSTPTFSDWLERLVAEFKRPEHPYPTAAEVQDVVLRRLGELHAFRVDGVASDPE